MNKYNINSNNSRNLRKNRNISKCPICGESVQKYLVCHLYYFNFFFYFIDLFNFIYNRLKHM